MDEIYLWVHKTKIKIMKKLIKIENDVEFFNPSKYNFIDLIIENHIEDDLIKIIWNFYIDLYWNLLEQAGIEVLSSLYNEKPYEKYL